MKQGNPVLTRKRTVLTLSEKLKRYQNTMGVWVKHGRKTFRTSFAIVDSSELCLSKRIRNIFGKFCFSQLLIAAYITGCEAWDWNFKTFKNLKHVTRSKNSVAFNCYWMENNWDIPLQTEYLMKWNLIRFQL